MSDSSGLVLWITGFPGAGKSSISSELAKALKLRGENPVIVDGDRIRELFENDLGYTDADRLKNAWRIARLCEFLSRQNVLVVAATVSLYAEVRNWLRANCSGYREIYVRVSPETLRARNQKGLYSSAESTNPDCLLPGVTQLADEPENPHLVIDNDQPLSSFERITNQILSLIDK